MLAQGAIGEYAIGEDDPEEAAVSEAIEDEDGNPILDENSASIMSEGTESNAQPTRTFHYFKMRMAA